MIVFKYIAVLISLYGSILYSQNTWFVNPLTSYPITPGFTEDIATGDLNNDGYKDIVIACASCSSVEVIHSTGYRQYGPRYSHYFSGSPSQVELKDINCDGNLDIIIGGSSSNKFHVLVGDGTGFYEREAIQHNQSTLEMWWGYINDDSFLDVVSISQGGDSVAVSYSDGNLNFIHSTKYHSGGKRTNSLFIDDFNGDEIKDIVITHKYYIPNSSPLVYINPITALWGNDDGYFNYADTIVENLISYSPSYADFDNDGDNDIYIQGAGTYDYLFINDGNGNVDIMNSPFFTNGTKSYPLDLNNDGKIDIFQNHSFSGFMNFGNLTFYQNGAGALYQDYSGKKVSNLCSDDLDCDGRLDFVVTEYQGNVGTNQSNIAIYWNQMSIDPNYSYCTDSIDSLAIPEDNVLIYPNPTNNLVNISAEATTYKIHDLQGKIIQEGNISNSQISIGTLINGYYLLTLFSKYDPVTVPIIKL